MQRDISIILLAKQLPTFSKIMIRNPTLFHATVKNFFHVPSSDYFIKKLLNEYVKDRNYAVILMIAYLNDIYNVFNAIMIANIENRKKMLSYFDDDLNMLFSQSKTIEEFFLLGAVQNKLLNGAIDEIFFEERLFPKK